MRELAIPEPQVVQVLSYDGDAEVRLAALDREGNLVLHQVGISGGGDVQVGDSVTIRLTSIGSLEVQGKALKLRAAAAEGQVGKLLLELRFEGPSLATEWARLLQTKHSPLGGAAGTGGSGASAAAAAGGARQASPKASPNASPKAASGPRAAARDDVGREATLATLRKLVEQQEMQAGLLDELNKRKADQMMQLQQRLEGALEMLQQGQVAYSAQQRVVFDQQERIDDLKSRLKAASVAEAACARSEAEAGAGRRAAAQARAAGADAADCTDGVAEGGEDTDEAEDDDDDEVGEEDRALRERLQGLESQKEMLEAMLSGLQAAKPPRNAEASLQQDVGGIASQMSQLDELMQGLGPEDVGQLGLKLSDLNSMMQMLAKEVSVLGGGAASGSG